MRYRKRPVEVEAKKWFPTQDPRSDEVLEWLFGSDADYRLTDDGLSIVIDTLGGQMVASAGDYIIKSTHGEFYPCKPAVFLAVYEPMGE